MTARIGLPTSPRRSAWILSGHSSAVVFFDYDLDGLVDCYLTNVGNYTHDRQGPGPYWIGRKDAFEGHKFPERTENSILFKNLGNLRMEDVTEKVNLVDGAGPAMRPLPI